MEILIHYGTKYYFFLLCDISKHRNRNGHLKEIKTKIDSIPQKHWDMVVYMDDIPENEQNILHLGSVPLKIHESSEYSDLIVPHIGEEVSGIYYSGNHEFSMKFSMEGIVTNVHYNTDLDLIVVSCKCTEIRKI